MAPSWKIASSSRSSIAWTRNLGQSCRLSKSHTSWFRGQDRQLFLPPSPLNNSMRVLINAYNSIFRSRILHGRRSCRIDFLLGERRREEERKKGARKRKRRKKDGRNSRFLEESCSSGGIIVLFPTSNVSSGNKNKKADESRCGGIDC